MNTYVDLFWTFTRIGAFTFGGGYAMISLIDYECVEKKKWLTAEEFTQMTVIAESTPGPIAINLATYTGYKKKGLPGAFLSTVGVVLPSFLIILLISSLFPQFMEVQVVTKAFAGIRIAVALLIVRAAINMMRKMLVAEKNKVLKGITAGLMALFFLTALVLNFLGISFSTIYFILIAGFLGWTVFGIAKKGGKK